MARFATARTGPVMLAVGLMSGTSLDGIDAALIETDGEGAVRPVAFATEPYSRDERQALTAAVERALAMDAPGDDPVIRAAELMLTDRHAALVKTLLNQAGVLAPSVAVVGFHGQTVAHRPESRWTWQIGDAARLATALGIMVIDQFRRDDVAAGGQGAPLLPVYHRALCSGLEKPVAVLNLGGVANITWIGEGEGDLIAFDTGPANGLVDRWVERATGQPFDDGGRLAGAGAVHLSVVDAMLDNPWFDLPPPKSLDRHDFTDQPAFGLSLEDGAATLTAFTAATVGLAIDQLPARPRRLLVAGGGRHNPVMLRMIADRAGLTPEPVDALGWNGDAIEAEGFAYMAVRTLGGRPISFPGTTGAPGPLAGGNATRP